MTTEVLFDASPKQEEFIAAVFSGQYRYLLYGGGAGSGKTYAGLGCLLLLLKKYPGSRAAIVRDSLATLKRTTIPSFFKLFPMRFIRSYNQDTQVVTMANDSQVIFFAEDYDNDKELNRWKGLEVNFFLLEEASELQEQSFNKAIERCGRHIPLRGEKPSPIIMLTTNPDPGWVKEKFYDKHKNGILPPEFYYLPSTMLDNPHVMADQAYVESLKNMPRYEYEKFVLGNWEVTLKIENAIYRGFDLDKHIGVVKYDPALPLHLSFDENSVPYTPAGLFQIFLERDSNGQIIKIHVRMIDELLGRYPNNTIEAVCNLFKKKYHNHHNGLFIYGDATSRKSDTKIEAGHNLFTLIEGHLKQFRPRLRVLASNPSVIMRINFFNAVLEKNFEKIHFIIDENCKEAINDFQKTQEDVEGKKLKQLVTDPKTKVRYQAHGHMTDLSDYFMVSAFAGEYARYKGGGRSNFPMKSGRNTSKQSY